MLSTLETQLRSSYHTNSYASHAMGKKGYFLDESLSGKREKVYVNKTTGRPLVVFRGTQTLSNWGTNLMIGLGQGKRTSRVKHSKSKVKQVAKKYRLPADASGHSLGGYLAENSGAPGRIVTFNKASLGTARTGQRQINIRTSTDLVSAPDAIKKNIGRIFGTRYKRDFMVPAASSNFLVAHSTKELRNVSDDKRHKIERAYSNLKVKNK